MVLLYTGDILLCFLGRRPENVVDINTSLYILQVFGFFSGLLVNFANILASSNRQT